MLLGWSPGGNQEIVSLDKAVKNFSIKKVNKTAATFSLDKLNWVNSEYIKKLEVGKLTDLITPFLKNRKYLQEDFDRDWLNKVVKLYQGRINNLGDFLDWTDFLFLDKPVFNEQAREKLQSKNLSKEFSLLAEKVGSLESFDAHSIEEEFRALVQELDMSASDLVHPVRAALTGKLIGPGLFETIEILGCEKTKQRLVQVYEGLKRKE